MFATHTFFARARHLSDFGVKNYLADAVPLPILFIYDFLINSHNTNSYRFRLYRNYLNFLSLPLTLRSLRLCGFFIIPV